MPTLVSITVTMGVGEEGLKLIDLTQSDFTGGAGVGLVPPDPLVETCKRSGWVLRPS